MEKAISMITLFFVAIAANAQTDTAANKNMPGVFEKIANSVKAYQLDTTEAPADSSTKAIAALRVLKGGFNINEAIQYKIEEDRQKKEIPKEELDKAAAFFTAGNGKRWLDNATIWIYRKHFTYDELQQLVAFYKTPAGKKMATDFPIVMMESFKAAEIIKAIYLQQQKK